MIRLLVPLLLAPIASAQFVYDFNSLNGSDTPPFVLLDGQDNWTEQTFNANNRCGVTSTLSIDGTQSLRFQEVGPGFGCDASRINDSNWLFPPFFGGERTAAFQVDIQVGFWGGSFGLAHDTGGDGVIRGGQPGERGVRFTIGTNSGVQLRLYAADQTFVQVPLTNATAIGGGDWVRVRVVMDLGAGGGTGLGSVFVQNLSRGESWFSAAAGLQDIPLALDPLATDATNPILWDAVWLHFEGATYGLDNIEVGRLGFTRTFGVACSGAAGPSELRFTGSLQAGASFVLESNNHASNSLGATVFGFSDTTYQGAPLPALLDPLLGTSGCSLYTDIVSTSFGFTSVSSPATLAQSVALPPTLWTGINLFAQHVCFEPVPGGLSFSNAVRVQLP